MTAYRAGWPGPVVALARALMLGLAIALAAAASVRADDKAQLFPSRESGFGRLILTFPDRLDLPAYRLRYENNVVAIEFDEPIELLLPDVDIALPDYVAVARVDPDRRGVRFGLRAGFQVNRLEAGERLFLDLLPTNWQGLPPSLPREVIENLEIRAKEAAIRAEQQRKAEEARMLRPVAEVRVGRNPTFMRVQFNWSTETDGKFEIAGEEGVVTFDWPVPVDLYALKANLPEGLLGADNIVDDAGSHIQLKLAEGVVPRFYRTSPRQFVIDIDIDRETGIAAALAAEAARQAEIEAAEAARLEDEPSAEGSAPSHTGIPSTAAIVPVVSTVGATVRVTFPFEQDTAAAVFRRGDTVWMLFDTASSIGTPAHSDALASIAKDFAVIPAGGTKVVRLDLASERLATLGSEGRSWVLSLGDVLLNPTEPMPVQRHRDDQGQFEMAVDLRRPAQIHEFRDPVAGDVLRIVTAFPPARGAARNLQYVDFGILRSVHGLVIKGENEALEVALQGTNAVIRAPKGLTLSALEGLRTRGGDDAPEYRSSYVDFSAIREDNPLKFVERREALINRASQTEGRLRDVARLELAQFQLANQFAHEAIGVLRVLEADLDAEDLKKKVRLARGIADTLARRSADALATFNSDSFAEEVDALMWRAIAKADLGEYAGARADALASEGVFEAYPVWIRSRFLLSALRAAIETDDVALALRYLEMVDFAKLDPEQVTTYHLLQGRVAEAENRIDEALDAYGQVIAADIRPTRAEAVYRTLLLLDRTGRIDLARATETLSAEALLWRGDALEAGMQKLLAELYFRHRNYRLGFETVRQAVAYHPENPGITAILARAQQVFSELYLDGRADELEPIEALSLYYDYRQLTPPGNRGDEMIRNLARRLVKVDLLTQAANLLEYQIDSRLKGVAQAQIAADLAIIRIADRDPEGALRVLNRTRLADLSPLLERQRRILEARALIDAGRVELAADLLGTIKGRDADLLRVEAYWKSKRYGPAAELLEVMHSAGLHPDPLLRPARMNVIRAAVGFVLAGDQLALSRLRTKFSDQMAQTAEWPIFDFVTGDILPSSIEFRRVAREVSGLDSLNAFLDAYRQTYAAGDPMTPAKAAVADAA